ncbi:hypothetical protein M513_11738 [Trichuris suis]|uniref:Uncharacterized protein n=1 Tax=Trichuris suis TaxID=68888 RepID=A0A085LQX9_9BILA|nr:hypothetical protein M513_11738 [Trichuris suis]
MNLTRQTGSFNVGSAGRASAKGALPPPLGNMQLKPVDIATCSIGSDGPIAQQFQELHFLSAVIYCCRFRIRNREATVQRNYRKVTKQLPIERKCKTHYERYSKPQNQRRRVPQEVS